MAAKKELKFGIPVPQVFLGGKTDMELVKNALSRAEELGFHGAWVQDQVHGFVPLMESVSLLCYAAACTSTLKLGVSVIVSSVRNPVHLAKALSSLDQMSGGRLIVGLGLGPPKQSGGFYQAFGVEYNQRLRLFNDGLDIMKSLWTEPKTNYEGVFGHLQDVAMEPKPFQKPHPPIWIGGQHPNAIRRAVLKGDGYTSAGPTPIVEYKEHVKLARQYLEEEGRDPENFTISRRVYLAVDRDESKAKAILDDWFAKRYPWILKQRPNMVEEICVWGSPEKVTEGLSDIASGGAETFILNPLTDYIDQMEVLAAEILPHVSA